MSGVGPAWLLQNLGVPVVADLPVGENFRDHYNARIVARVKNIRTFNEMARGFGIDQKRAASLRPEQGRSYFLTRMIKDVVFGEATLVAVIGLVINILSALLLVLVAVVILVVVKPF